MYLHKMLLVLLPRTAFEPTYMLFLKHVPMSLGFFSHVSLVVGVIWDIGCVSFSYFDEF